MPLTRFGFIVTGAGLDPGLHRQRLRSDTFEMVTVGVTSPAQPNGCTCRSRRSAGR